MHSVIPSSISQDLPASPASTLKARALFTTGPDCPSAEQIILVVDDDETLRNTAAMMLECQGFKTLVARNGLEALHQLERHPHISAVLLDLLMPVMDGEQTLQQIRQSWAGIPVVLISGFDFRELRREFGQAEPDGFVKKPFTFANLTSALASVLN